jgi:hypothetical protein
MKLALQSLALMVAAVTIPSVIADFHIIQGIAPGGGTGLEACPSNYDNCKCMKDGDRAAQVFVNGKGVANLPDDSFSLKAGFCGIGKLNFYKQSNGAWNFYVDGGDGSLQGTCYSSNAGNSCSGGFIFYDKLVCYSYICGS